MTTLADIVFGPDLVVTISPLALLIMQVAGAAGVVILTVLVFRRQGG